MATQQGMLDPRQLAALQAAATALLDIPGCVIQRRAPESDGLGSQTDNWTTVATLACGLAKPSAQIMQQYAARIGAQQAWTVRLPAGTDVRVDDQLVVSGLTLRVQAALNPASYSVSQRVLASEVR